LGTKGEQKQKGGRVKGFKFRLQSVLEAREQKFKDAQLEYAKVQSRLYREKMALDSMYKDHADTNAGLEQVIKSGLMDYTLISCHQNYLLKVKGNIEYQHKLIGRIENELAEKNRLMLEAMKEKKIMEKLKEKALEEFKKNAQRQDFINIDEIATNRHKKAS
jgi:flagellar FliJ protein